METPASVLDERASQNFLKKTLEETAQTLAVSRAAYTVLYMNTLTRVPLKLSNPHVQRSLKDAQSLHAQVQGFTENIETSRLLYKFDPASGELVLNTKLPHGAVPDEWTAGTLKEVTEPSFTAGEQVELEGVVHPIVQRERNKPCFIKKKEEREAWVKRKLEGFTVESYIEEFHVQRQVNKPSVRFLFTAVHVKVTGKVTDPELFNSIMKAGVGPRKAYGCGYFTRV